MSPQFRGWGSTLGTARSAPVHYQLYYLDVIELGAGVLPIESRTDETAISIAKCEAGGRPFELWNKERLVVRY